MELEKYEKQISKETAPLEDTARHLLELSQGVAIASDEDLKAANELKKRINTHSKTVKEMRLELTRPIDRVKAFLLNREKEILSPLDEAKNSLAGKMLTYEEEIERQQRIRQARIDDLIKRITGFYHAGMNAEQVAAGKAQGKDMLVSLSDTDRENPNIKLALQTVANNLNNRLEEIKAEEEAAAERARLAEEAKKQSAERQKIAEENYRIEAEKRELEAEKRKAAQERAQLELEKQAAAAEKEAAKAEKARPKSNIATVTEFEITDADAVPRKLCSPDEKKIRAFIKEWGNDSEIAGMRIFETKKVR